MEENKTKAKITPALKKAKERIKELEAQLKEKEAVRIQATSNEMEQRGKANKLEQELDQAKREIEILGEKFNSMAILFDNYVVTLREQNTLERIQLKRSEQVEKLLTLEIDRINGGEN